VTEVPLEDPANELGEGWLPETVMVKSDGFLVPALLFTTFLTTSKNVNEPGIGVGFGHLLLTGEEPLGQMHSPFTISEPSGHFGDMGVGFGHLPLIGSEPLGH